MPTAAVVVEIVSPDDETYEKFNFYAARSVDELLVVDPSMRAVTCWRRRADVGFEQVVDSELLGVSAVDLAAAIDWPELAP